MYIRKPPPLGSTEEQLTVCTHIKADVAVCRRQAFDANMTRDYVLNSVSMDNPELVAYIREVQLKPTTQQDPLNATQTSEERYVWSLTEGKRDGVYVEYISRVSDLFVRQRLPCFTLTQLGGLVACPKLLVSITKEICEIIWICR